MRLKCLIALDSLIVKHLNTQVKVCGFTVNIQRLARAGWKVHPSVLVYLHRRTGFLCHTYVSILVVIIPFYTHQ